MWAGGRCSVSSDVYSLGVTLFYLLTGAWPREGATTLELAQNVVTARGPRLTDLAPHAPRAAVLVVNKAMAVDPGARHVSAAELAAELGMAARAVGREWQRTDEHPGHRACVRGEPTATRTGVLVCLVPDGVRWALRVVAQPSGRRNRRSEPAGLTAAAADRALREAVARL